MDNKPTGGAAFASSAVVTPTGNLFSKAQEGMTLRDYFAGQAIVGLLANPESEATIQIIAEASYRVADVMIKERKK